MERAQKLLLIWAFCTMALQLQLQAQAYDSRGKLDPFIDLNQLLSQDQPQVLSELPPLSQRPPGLAGLAISEVIVTGMAIGKESKVVLLRGIDNFTYLAREGNKLFNGYVSNISEEGVVFIQELVDTRGNKETTKIVKRLYTEED
ncbi:hypothetical protein MYX84_00105 [Acidobacteria bacterium AH-259-O06]|nr:hypothetical protein [Acidobacteria bacterium AH-259-O06]